MFRRDHNLTQEPVKGKVGREDSAPVKEGAFESNSLWRSLALRTAIVQPKLTVGQANDPCEQEADRISEQIVSRPQRSSLFPSEASPPSIQRECQEYDEEEKLQRKCQECEEEGNSQLKEDSASLTREALRTPGQQLDRTTRAFMEYRFGLDFGNVREIYANRYWIEEMLSDHKSRGLNLESTRLTDPDRIKRLLVAVTLAYLWIMEVGALVVTSGQRRQVDNRGASRSVSLCQIGLRWLSERRNLGFLPPLFSGCFKPLEAV